MQPPAQVKWTYAPELPPGRRSAFNSRGESWWSDGHTNRLLVTAANFVYSLDPATGQPDPAFGDHGRIDLNDNLRGDASANYVRMGGAVTIWHDLFFTCGEVAEETPGLARRYPRLGRAHRQAGLDLPHHSPSR